MPKSWCVLAFCAWLFSTVHDFERTPGLAFLAASLICPRIVLVCNMLTVHRYFKNFSSPCSSLSSKLSERIKERKLLNSFLFFYSCPYFIDHLARKCLPPGLSMLHRAFKYRMFFILPSNHQNMSRNSI